MKLTALILTVAFASAHAEVVSQNITISGKDLTLKAVFTEIEHQTGYSFFYSYDLLKEAHPVTIEAKNVPLLQILDRCFKDQPLAFNMERRTIVITEKGAALQADEEMRPIVNLLPAPPPVSGKVTDQKGNPLSGASVKIKGTNRGVVTDKEGNYSLAVPDGASLVFSYTGYEPATEAIKGRKVINISLQQSIQDINDVVVIGYGTQRRTNVTGAISTVRMDDVLGDRPVSTVSALMQNVVPGLNVTVSSGQPGASTSLNIRGATDLGTGGNAINTGGPLILVDNVPFNGPLNLINPSDIETLTVLKDAGSAAIYGGRSAFGVILITLKQGRKNAKPKFVYSNNITLSSATDLPKKASPRQFLQALQDMGTTSFWSGQNVSTWLNLYDSIQNPGSKFPNGVDYIGGVAYPLVATDMVKDLLGSTVPQTQNDFAVSGGSDKITYRLALGNTNEKGLIDPAAHIDYFKRYNVSSAISVDVTNWLTTQANVNYYNQFTSTPSNNQFSLAVQIPSLAPISDSLLSGTGVMGINGTPKNDVSNGGANTSKNGDIRLTGRGILKPLKGLTITGEYTYDNLANNYTNYSQTSQMVLPTNFQLAMLKTQNGVYQAGTSSTIYKSLNIYGNYEKSFGYHNLAFMAGYNQEENINSTFSTSRNGMIVSNKPSISNATGPLSSSDGYSAYALQGYFGRISYDYKGKYLAQINSRYDGTSNFPAGHRFGFFPSGSLGWRVSEEDFMKSLKPILPSLKLRASYGSVGNQNIGSYQFIPTISGTQPYWLNGTGAYLLGLSTPGLISSNFTWEKVETLDFGVDFGLFSNRLTGSFDLYRRDTKDILAPGATPLPTVLGTGAPLENTASIRSIGKEIQLGYNDRIGKNIKWHISANVSDNTAKVTKFDGNPTNLLSTYYVGQKVGAIWGYTTAGLYTTDDFVSGTLNNNLLGGTLKPGVAKFQGENPNPGDIKYRDYDGNGIINPGQNTLDSSGDMRIIGNNNPRYVYGINGGISYKNFSFSFVITGVGKQDLALINNLTFPNIDAFGTIYANELNYWTPTHTNAYYGRIYDQAAGNQGTNQQTQTRFLQNGAFVRINNLTLDYALPVTLLKKAHIDALHVFCSVENPFLFDHLPKGTEPGLSDQGSGLQYPYLRKTSFGVNLSF